MLAIVIGGVAAYVVFVAALYGFQRSLLYLPASDRPVLASAGLADLREVSLQTEDGLQLLSWYLPPADGRPLVVYFHGNAGHIGHRVQALHTFARAGFGVLLAGYRGYGGNPGAPTEAGLLGDGRAALAFAAGQEIAPGRIVLFGESLGGGVAARMAAEHPVGALVLQSPFTSVAAAAQHHYPFVPAEMLVRDRFDILAALPEVRAPVLVLHGERDNVVPVAFGREVLAAAAEPKEGRFFPQAGHNDLAAYGALEAAVDFIRRHLGA